MVQERKDWNFEKKSKISSNKRKKIKPAQVRATKERVINVNPYYILS